MSRVGVDEPARPAQDERAAVSFFAPDALAAAFPPVARRAPASLGQASLWFLREIMPCKTPYNTAVGLRLTGEVDAGALVEAVREVARRHESFRTTFAVDDGQVVQVISDAEAADVAIVDATGASEPEAEAERIARAAASQAFDLSRGPLLRVRIVRIGPRDALLCAVMDHIIADGLSLGILWREIEALYPAILEGRPSPLFPPNKQFSACAEEQRRWMETPAFAKHLAWWKDRLAGAAACELPADRPRPPVKSYAGGFVSLPIPPDLAGRLRALAGRLDTSLFAVLLSGLFALLARASGQRDLALMVPVACRNRFDADDAIGFFSNMIVIRAAVPERAPFHSLVKLVAREVMVGVLRQDVPFEKVVEALRPDRSLAHDPLARIALSFLPAEGATLSLPGVEASYAEIPNGGAKFDLHVTIAERPGAEGLTCIAEYNADIFDAATMEALLGRYHRLLDCVSRAPDSAVDDLPLLASEERRRILVEWNRTEASYPREASLPELVRAAARKAPGAPAVVFEGQEMRYDALCRRAAQVARCLRARGVAPGERVGIALDRSVEMPAALLGILEAGAAYVPLDPAYPKGRLAHMAEDAGLAALITERRHQGIFPAPRRGVLLVDDDAGEIAAQDDGPLGVAFQPEQVAYVIYTSGSTGKPKGVEVPHRALTSFLTSMARAPGLGPADRLLAVTSLAFDIAGLELWLPLTVGAVVEIASRDTASSGEALRRAFDAGRITVIQATPSTFRLLLEAGWQPSPGLRVLVGGEAVPRDLVNALACGGASVWNMYGPTETTIWSTIERLDAGEGPVTIGRPIANTQVYVLDAGLEPVPPGVLGELYIGGAGVARGYLGRPDLTAERFVPDPFREGERLYRTGDLVRFRGDGALEYLGRADFQIKLRGHRIELGEIEATLARHAAVREAVALVYEEAPGDQRLAAYVTAQEAGVAPSSAELRAHLRASLPEYMVPGRFIVIDRMPLTQNGKIDRKALPAPDREVAVAPEGEAPADEELTVKLRMVWEQVLRVRGIGLRDSFWDLGGHSLLALQLFDRMEQALGVKLPVAALFDAPTIGGLAALLRTEGWKPSWASLVPIQVTGDKGPFFCVHAVGGNVLNYRLLARHLGRDQPFYGLQSRGLGGDEAPHDTVEEMARSYIAEIREVQPRGPYRLGGSSSGGAIAYEMAQQLVAAGERVAALVMFDSALVGRPPARVSDMLARSRLHGRGVKVDYHVGNLLLRTPREGAAYLAERVEARFRGESSPIVRAMNHAPSVARRVFEHTIRALDAYTPRPYPGGATMLLSEGEPHRTFYDERLLWADLVQGGLVVRFVPGDHETMLDEPCVGGVAEVLAKCLG